MKRRKLVIAATAGLIATCLFSFVAIRHTEQDQMKATQYSPTKEQVLKQTMLKQDMNTTKQLTMIDARGHLSQWAADLASQSPVKQKQFVKKIQLEHKHFQCIKWLDLNKKRSHSYCRETFKPNKKLEKQIENHIKKATTALRSQESYESQPFPQNDSKYIVAAKRSKEGNTALIIVMDTGILDHVKSHQKKNLRLIPYPKEGKYSVESVHADTLRDITVKTGHDNEKASHYYENEIVVTFDRELTKQELGKIHAATSFTSYDHSIANTYVFKSKKLSMEKLSQYFKKNWEPQYIEPHYMYLTNEDTSSIEIPNDILFTDYQYNLPMIETNRGWNLSKGAEQVIIGVVDTGVDLNHPDLQGRLLSGYNTISPDSKPSDDVGHGTHVAGIISANVNNREGIAGMTWNNKILPVKALDQSGAGTSYSVAEGIIWAADHGAKVINLSLGNYADANFLHEAIKYAYNKDIVIVAATGNDNTERPGYPAAYPEVLSVSATNYNMQRASFSNYGDYIDVMAPGESIASTYPNNQYAALSGTSMASPHVAALAGLIRSVNPKLKNTEVMDIIRSNVIDLGESGRDKYYGFGQINVYAALEAASGEVQTRSESQPQPLKFWSDYLGESLKKLLGSLLK
jgi:subtilisin family serine protease